MKKSKVMEQFEKYEAAVAAASNIELLAIATLPRKSTPKQVVEGVFIAGTIAVEYLTDPVGSFTNALIAGATATGLCIAANVATQDASRAALGELLSRGSGMFSRTKKEVKVELPENPTEDQVRDTKEILDNLKKAMNSKNHEEMADAVNAFDMKNAVKFVK